MLPKKRKKSKQKKAARLSTAQIIFVIIGVLVIASFVVSLVTTF